MTNCFADRFAEDNYHTDNRVTIGVQNRHDESIEQKLQIPQRIFLRCQHIAEAYSLHLLGLLSLGERVRFDQAQCKTIEAELDFVISVVNDPLLHHHLYGFLQLVQQCTRYPLSYSIGLVIGGPYDELDD